MEEGITVGLKSSMCFNLTLILNLTTLQFYTQTQLFSLSFLTVAFIPT